MNKKGMNGIGVGSIVLLSIGLIVALVLLSESIADNVGQTTTTYKVVNYSVTAPAAGASIYLDGQAWRDVTIINQTSRDLVPASNYTITNYVVYNDKLMTKLTSSAEAGDVGWNGKKINISATTVEPWGYDTSGAGRSVTMLIIIFCAIAIAVFAMTPIFRDKILDFVGV